MKNESKTEIKKETKMFLEMNENETTTYPKLWDTIKVVLRGRVIDLSAYSRKMKSSLFVT